MGLGPHGIRGGQVVGVSTRDADDVKALPISQL
jgi:hypothetical protein